jgi:phosphate-selective porin OprO/OprP
LNGRGHLANAGRDLVDDNDGKEVEGRMTIAPFVQDKQSFLSGLRAGVWGSYAHEGQGSVATGLNPGAFPPAVGYQSTDFLVSYLEFPNTFVFHGTRLREGAELTYAVGPFEFRGEVMQRRDEFVITGAASPFVGADRMLGMHGYYGQVSYIVTGEEKIPDARISPRNTLDPSNGDWGALELAARLGGVSFTRATLNEIFAPTTASAQGNSNRMTSLAAGFNWWFTPNTKLAFDYIAEHYFDSVTLGAESRKHLNGFLTQIQLDF